MRFRGSFQEAHDIGLPSGDVNLNLFRIVFLMLFAVQLFFPVSLGEIVERYVMTLFPI
jgi:hypothetical protein